MRIPKLIFILIPLVIAGCHGVITQSGRQDQSDTTRSEKKGTAKKHLPVLGCDSTITNNEFSSDALAFKVFKADTTKIKSLFLDPVSLKLEKQTGSQGNSFYLYIFTDGVNKLSLYNNDGFYLEDGDIKNDKIRLNRKISIGMAKDEFLKLIKRTNIRCDTITVADDESSFETVYIFNGSGLKEIRVGQIVE